MVRAIEQGHCAKDVRLMTASIGSSSRETQQVNRVVAGARPLLFHQKEVCVAAMKGDLLGGRLVVPGAPRAMGERVAGPAAPGGAGVPLIGLDPGVLGALADDRGPAASWREADVRDGAALRSAIDEAA